MNRAAVIGLGLIGGSLAAALRAGGTLVRGFDASERSVRTAADRALIDEPAVDLASALEGADVVVLSIPVLSIVELLPLVDSLASPAAILLDTGSVKHPIIDVMARLPGAERALGGHPLAGKERSGPEAADPELFRGRPFVLVPSDRSSSSTVERARALVSRLGAHPVLLDAGTHDRVLAQTSHLPQILSTTLASLLEPGDEHLVGPAFHEMTRLAASDVPMWRDILLANREHVVRATNGYIRELQAFVACIAGGDQEAISATLERGRRAAACLQRGTTP